MTTTENADGEGRGQGRSGARAITVGVAVLFVLQLAYVSKADEPYPAIMMPRFSWAGPSEVSAVEIPVPEIVLHYADGTMKRLDQAALLGGIPTGHQTTLMGNIMTPLPEKPVVRRAPPGKLEPPGWLFPGYNLAKISRNRPEHVAALSAWLRERAKVFYSAAPPTKCVVDWYVDSFPYDPAKSPSESGHHGHELSGKFEVDLNADATTRL